MCGNFKMAPCESCCCYRSCMQGRDIGKRYWIVYQLAVSKSGAGGPLPPNYPTIEDFCLHLFGHRMPSRHQETPRRTNFDSMGSAIGLKSTVRIANDSGVSYSLSSFMFDLSLASPTYKKRGYARSHWVVRWKQRKFGRLSGGESRQTSSEKQTYLWFTSKSSRILRFERKLGEFRGLLLCITIRQWWWKPTVRRVLETNANVV